MAERVYVLETGEIFTSDLASELKQNKKVQEAYLGETALKKFKSQKKDNTPF
jgi:ABC-type lipopolysaccharide export system ATPase subunit